MDSSPRITRLDWGRIETPVGSFKDAKLWPGGARDWDWNETGTSHDGVQAADTDELVDGGASTVILTRGQHGRLTVPDAVVEQLETRGITVEVLGTVEAVERYNHLADAGEAVGALIHSTC
ncbi:MAG: Mth938-like domain-containing protein [Actinobacteria bacterium]|nr:Mth938-like domain-containing protein [Actinomycetota bacterium]